MYFYEIAIVGQRLQPLSYTHSEELEIGTFAQVKIRNVLKEGIVLKEVEEPTFKCALITEILAKKIAKSSIEIASFMSYYYFCTLAEVLSLFYPQTVSDTTQKTSDFSTDIELSSMQDRKSVV